MATAPRYEHGLVWTCPTCDSKRRTSKVSNSREVVVAPEICRGIYAAHAPHEMYWSDHTVLDLTPRKHYAQGGFIGPHTPRKAVDLNMTNSFGALGAYVDRSFLEDIARLHTPKPNPAAVKAKEQAEVIAKIQEGDIVQLVSKAGAVIQGEVLALKRLYGRRGAPTKVRIKGFDHVGGEAGGHHVYWPLSEYDVEILVETYRLTDEDRAVAVLAGYGEDGFKVMSEVRRQALRKSYGAKARRVAEILKGGGG